MKHLNNAAKRGNMVCLSVITTKKGDSGYSSLADGTRLPKENLRFEVLGDLDELNVSLGALLAREALPPSTTEDLRTIQHVLFDLGGELAFPKKSSSFIKETNVKWLEQKMTLMLEKQQPINSFILPGGTPPAAEAHRARAITRRAERHAWRLHQNNPLNSSLLCYLNRLSDYLFVLARHLNDEGEKDIKWEKALHS